MRRTLLLCCFATLIGVVALPGVEAEQPRTATFDYVANAHLRPGGAVMDVALGAVRKQQATYVPRSRRLTVTVDDTAARDGQYVVVMIVQAGRTVFWDCMPVRRARSFTVVPGREVMLDVHTLPACGPGPCSMPLVEARVPGDERGTVPRPPVGARSTVPVCAESPPWSSGTAGTLRVSG